MIDASTAITYNLGRLVLGPALMGAASLAGGVALALVGEVALGGTLGVWSAVLLAMAVTGARKRRRGPALAVSGGYLVGAEVRAQRLAADYRYSVVDRGGAWDVQIACPDDHLGTRTTFSRVSVRLPEGRRVTQATLGAALEALGVRRGEIPAPPRPIPVPPLRMR